MNNATDHIRALLVNDGHEFAMIRKADLAALMQIADTDPHQGRYLNPLADASRKVAEARGVTGEAFACIEKMSRIARKHGEERRRYMANNRALLSHVDQLEAQVDGIRADKDHICSSLLASIDESARFEAGLLRVDRFKRKFPALGALLDLTP